MSELYKLTCHVCHCTIEIPTELRACVRCGTTFEIDWEVERREYEARSEKQNPRKECAA